MRHDLVTTLKGAPPVCRGQTSLNLTFAYPFLFLLSWVRLQQGSQGSIFTPDCQRQHFHSRHSLNNYRKGYKSINKLSIKIIRQRISYPNYGSLQNLENQSNRHNTMTIKYQAIKSLILTISSRLNRLQIYPKGGSKLITLSLGKSDTNSICRSNWTKSWCRTQLGRKYLTKWRQRTKTERARKPCRSTYRRRSSKGRRSISIRSMAHQAPQLTQ